MFDLYFIRLSLGRFTFRSKLGGKYGSYSVTMLFCKQSLDLTILGKFNNMFDFHPHQTWRTL